MKHALHGFLLVAILGASAEAAADNAFLVETDPSTFLFSGYSLHLRVAPASAPAWTFGVGTYAMDMPDLMATLAPANRDEGWHSRLAGGYGLFVDRDLSGDGEGLFVGGQAAVQSYELRRDSAPGTEQHLAALLMARVGYLWFPTSSGLYLMPWAGLGGTMAIAGEREIDGEQYEVLPAIAFGALHAGWRF